MATARAQWKGTLQVGALSVPVALYTAASTAERTTFNMVNRDTGNRLRREFIDPTTGKPVEKEDQVKGFEIEPDNYVVIEPDELDAAIPQSDKKLAIQAFVPFLEVDPLFFDKPYYLAPSGPGADAPFSVLRNALQRREVGALAHAVLFRRYRAVLIRASGPGMIAHTLNFDYEVRSAAGAFEEIPEMEIKGEMLELARHIISTKVGKFDPAAFTDRYEAAIAELVKAKIEGRTISAPRPRTATNVVNLMEALRLSAGVKKADRKQVASPKTSQPSKKAG
ncbi:Ku protein [Bosea sp. BIWAKO-01]|uniref:non-homologous end joining protein Ku n=1 Tax=Bosea sp. BIWAKO-01 TaxID=506668 RepID=UPI0008536AD4|nr:Ku protein [Bosea sp. BIWAKO-01]GAU84173.1 Ku domain protein [Bosea sp. BIWAKO-01]